MIARNDYSEDVADANEMIEEFGQTMYLVTSTSSGVKYNPTNTPKTYTCQGAVVDYSDREIDGDRVKVTDKKILLAKGNLPFDQLLTSWKLRIGGISHSIIRAVPLNPGGTLIFWTVQVRK